MKIYITKNRTKRTFWVKETDLYSTDLLPYHMNTFTGIFVHFDVSLYPDWLHVSYMSLNHSWLIANIFSCFTQVEMHVMRQMIYCQIVIKDACSLLWSLSAVKRDVRFFGDSPLSLSVSHLFSTLATRLLSKRNVKIQTSVGNDLIVLHRPDEMVVLPELTLILIKLDDGLWCVWWHL